MYRVEYKTEEERQCILKIASTWGIKIISEDDLYNGKFISLERDITTPLLDSLVKLQLDNFNIETELLNERMQRESVELSQFNLETALIGKGVI